MYLCVARSSRNQARKQIAVRGDGIRLQSPRLDPVRRPAETVVLAAECLRNLPHDWWWVIRALGVVANLREPVDRTPVSRVTARQFVGDSAVDLAPGRRLI